MGLEPFWELFLLGVVGFSRILSFILFFFFYGKWLSPMIKFIIYLLIGCRNQAVFEQDFFTFNQNDK